MLEFTTTSQLAVEHGVKTCIYGNSGVGKTMLAATVPKPLIAMAECGTLSLTRQNIERVFGKNTAGITYDIPIAKIKSVKDLELLYAKIFTPELWYSFDTLYLDSASEIVEQILKTALDDNKDGRAAYGDMYDITLEWFKKFRDIPGKNVVIVTEQGLSSDSGLFGPNMPGKQLDKKVPYLFDLILQMCIGEDPTTKQSFRFLRTQPDSRNYAKDRSGALDPRGEYPHLGAIFSKIFQSI